MTQTIDPAKLKASAEHLEWTLSQYPGNEDVQGLLHSLRPLIDAAKAGMVTQPVERSDVPGAYNFGDGLYIPYKNPSVGEAYTRFRTELRGGLTERDKQRHARLEALWEAKSSGGAS